VIARNSAEILARCLGSVRGAVDETVVVDTGSTDGTESVAAALGARVIRFEWTGDFSAARNRSLEEATGRWVLVLDTDEWMEAGAAQQVREFVEQWEHDNPDKRAAFRIRHRSVAAGSGGTGSLALLTRLFPRISGVCYEFAVHEQVETSLLRLGVPVLEDLWDRPVEILHDGYVEPEKVREKQWRNLEIFQEQIRQGSGFLPMNRFLLAGCLWDLGAYSAALAAYRLCYVEALQAGDVQLVSSALIRSSACLVKEKDWEGARELCRAGRAIGASHPEFLLTQARVAFHFGEREEAEILVKRLSQLEERPWVPPCDVGMLRMKAELWLTKELLRARLGKTSEQSVDDWLS
jgi:hypothetical protein